MCTIHTNTPLITQYTRILYSWAHCLSHFLDDFFVTDHFVMQRTSQPYRCLADNQYRRLVRCMTKRSVTDKPAQKWLRHCGAWVQYPCILHWQWRFILYINQIKSNLFVTQNYTIPIKDGKIEQCVNRTQRQLRATLTGAQTDIYGKS